MSSQKSKWIIFTAAVACIGCCAVPLYVIIAGASSVGLLATLLDKQSVEILICLALLVLIAGYFIYKHHKAKKSCCSAPTGECSNVQCDSNK